MFKRLLFPIVVIVLMVGVAIAKTPWGPVANPDPNHTHADFAVWMNGTQFDFSDQKYMSNPYVESGAVTFIPQLLGVQIAQAHEGEEEEESIPERKYLHLHDGNGHVIHRHKPGLTIGEFFGSIGFSMTETCFTTDTDQSYCNEPSGKTWRMFVNGTETTFSPLFVFEDGDQLLFTYGSDEAHIQKELRLLTDDACKYSKTCPWRGTPPTENCIADPTVPCVAP